MLIFHSGEDAGKIIIWNMGPVREENEEKDECVPKVLCQMDNHLGNVEYDKADLKKIYVCRHPTNPFKLPLPKIIYYRTFHGDFFFLHFSD